MREITLLDRTLIKEVNNLALQSNRSRQHYNLHQSFSDPCQRLLNSIEPDSYIRPHRHSLDPKNETLIAVSGLFGLVTFKDDGVIDRVEKFGTELYYRGRSSISVGVELSAGIWHTVVALKPGSVLLELKAGPFDPAAAKELAPWAPEEGGRGVAEYMKRLTLHLK